MAWNSVQQGECGTCGVFVHFNDHKTLETIAEGILHLTGNIVIHVFKFSLFLTNTIICSCSAINFHSDGHIIFFLDFTSKLSMDRMVDILLYCSIFCQT